MDNKKFNGGARGNHSFSSSTDIRGFRSRQRILPFLGMLVESPLAPRTPSAAIPRRYLIRFRSSTPVARQEDSSRSKDVRRLATATLTATSHRRTPRKIRFSFVRTSISVPHTYFVERRFELLAVRIQRRVLIRGSIARRVATEFVDRKRCGTRTAINHVTSRSAAIGRRIVRSPRRALRPFCFHLPLLFSSLTR